MAQNQGAARGVHVAAAVHALAGRTDWAIQWARDMGIDADRAAIALPQRLRDAWHAGLYARTAPPATVLYRPAALCDPAWIVQRVSPWLAQGCTVRLAAHDGQSASLVMIAETLPGLEIIDAPDSNGCDSIVSEGEDLRGLGLPCHQTSPAPAILVAVEGFDPDALIDCAIEAAALSPAPVRIVLPEGQLAEISRRLADAAAANALPSTPAPLRAAATAEGGRICNADAEGLAVIDTLGPASPSLRSSRDPAIWLLSARTAEEAIAIAANLGREAPSAVFGETLGTLVDACAAWPGDAPTLNRWPDAPRLVRPVADAHAERLAWPDAQADGVAPMPTPPVCSLQDFARIAAELGAELGATSPQMPSGTMTPVTPPRHVLIATDREDPRALALAALAHGDRLTLICPRPPKGWPISTLAPTQLHGALQSAAPDLVLLDLAPMLAHTRQTLVRAPMRHVTPSDIAAALDRGEVRWPKPSAGWIS